MIPYVGCKSYQGCKNSVALGILNVIPQAENFYDLFGGGGSVSQEALKLKEIFHKFKWANIYYNELNPNICNLIKWIVKGGKSTIKEIEKLYLNPLTREDFQILKAKKELKPIDVLAKICYSFGNNQISYLWSKENESNNLPIIKELACAIKDNGVRFGKFREFRKKFLSKKREDKRLKSLEKIERIRIDLQNLQSLERLQNLESLQSLERLENLERLQRLERLENLESLQRLEITNLDYRAVKIKPNSVVYCDIPYEGTKDFYRCNFDTSAFYEWAATRSFPVYFSGYECSRDFKCVWSKINVNRYTKKGGKGIYRTEKLFWNGRTL